MTEVRAPPPFVSAGLAGAAGALLPTCDGAVGALLRGAVEERGRPDRAADPGAAPLVPDRTGVSTSAISGVGAAFKYSTNSAKRARIVGWRASHALARALRQTASSIGFKPGRSSSGAGASL